MTKRPTITVSKASVADLIRRLFQDGNDRSLAQVRDEVGYGATAWQVSRALTKLVRAGELYRPQRGVYSLDTDRTSLRSRSGPNEVPNQRSETSAPQVVGRKLKAAPARPPVTVPRRASLTAPSWGPALGEPVAPAPEPVAVLVADGVAAKPIPDLAVHSTSLPRPSNLRGPTVLARPDVRIAPRRYLDVEPYEVPTWIRDGAFLAPLFWLVITGLALIVGGLMIGLGIGAGCLVAVVAFYVGTAKHRAKARASRANMSRSRYRNVREAA